MPLDLNQVRLESLSEIRYTFWTGKHPGQSYERTVLVIRFEGTYRFGCSGNPDATFMRSMGEAAVEAFGPDALITDLSGLSYEWGDEMDSVFGIGRDRKNPTALVVGEKCQKAIGTLCFGIDSTKDACEEEWIFDSLDAAWNYVTKLLDEGATPPIHEAAKSGDFQRVKQLLESGETPNRCDSSGLTPLHEATDPAIVRLLIEAGADAKAKNTCGITPLHLVKNCECAHLLLNAGADPDARSWTGSSPLGHVQSAEIAKLLIEVGADVHLRQRSSLLHTVRNTELAKVFIGAGVNVNTVDEKGRTPLDVAEESRQLFQRQAEQYGFVSHADRARQYYEIVALIRANGGKHGQQESRNP